MIRMGSTTGSEGEEMEPGDQLPLGEHVPVTHGLGQSEEEAGVVHPRPPNPDDPLDEFTRSTAIPRSEACAELNGVGGQDAHR